MKYVTPITCVIAALMASCAHKPLHTAGPASGHYGKDALGHRAGPQGFKTVIIDAGHGGKDSGAQSAHTRQQEKDLTLDIAKRVNQQLSGSFQTVMVRSDDRFIDLDDRVSFANQYSDAVLVSIHFNSGPQHLSGPETYYWRVDSHGLATRLHQAMLNLSGSEGNNRGMVRRRLRLTRNPEIPCVLVEGGYLSHPSESRKLASEEFRQQLASGIAQAIKAQSAQGDAGTGPLPAPRNEPLSRPSDKSE